MKPLSELNHYELLEIGRDAGADEVERAYRMAAITWEQDSLATYSLFDESEAQAMRERIEHAFAVLSDPEARDAYDREFAGAEPDPIPHDAIEIALALDEPAVPAPALGDFAETFDEDDAPYDGARLRRNRLQRGVELEQIAQITKVNPRYLRYIEDEHFDDLPAPVYVRGFVSAYVRCLGLDPERIVPEYLERLESARGAAQDSGGGA